MWNEFYNIDDLLNCVKNDKNVKGDAAFIANRYPIRFVLFDNFKDSFDFIHQLTCNVESVEKWIDNDYPDRMITHSELIDRFHSFLRKNEDKDFVIAPFSELARFYDNGATLQFDALIRTIKSVESTQNGFNNKQRIYVPIIGLEGKMSMFANDTQINIWHLKNSETRFNYRLILTNSSYDIENLDFNYTVVVNIKEWLKVWRKENAKQNIISLSPSLLANAEFAQPDNAFDFCICNNVYEFITCGLKLNFGKILFRKQDEKYWLRLAKEIDINNFSLESFFNAYFHIDELADHSVFMKTWFDCKDDFEKWLLCTYYLEKFCNHKSYICQVIRQCESYNNRDLFASIALTIFSCEEPFQYIEEREACIQFAIKHKINLTIEAETQLENELRKIENQYGCVKAVRLITSFTNIEKSIALHWLGEGKISPNSIKDIFADLYNYITLKNGTIINSDVQWVKEYFDSYRKSKISNKIDDYLHSSINTLNANNISFNNWYQSFKTVKTILNNRTDIDVFYWIDGLGVEWIPFISHLISQEQGMYLNEVHIARSMFPTTTSVNKPILEDLSIEKIKKIGDIDAHAHSHSNKYPTYIIEEFQLIKESILKIINEYSGKKIAIVSDHGLTAMSQYCDGLNLVGFKSDHGGRTAAKESGKPVNDENYIICDDDKTICALKHSSLCAKIPTGQSAHGGCTPEEILVPILIISSQKESNNYSTRLITTEITSNNTFIEFEMNGVETDNPHVVYNGTKYALKHLTDNTYRSEELTIVPGSNRITLCIGENFRKTYNLKINVGAEEEDLFDF